jgi:hypothetical protein
MLSFLVASSDPLVDPNATLFDVIILVAVVLFVLIAINVLSSPKWNLLAAGLAIFALAFLWL